MTTPTQQACVQIVPATRDHADRLVLRAGDAAEIAALGVSRERALHASLARSVWAETYLFDDGEPMAIAGLGRSALVGGHGVPWLLTGPACERRKKFFLLESRRQVRRMLDEVSPLINYVHAEYHQSIRWFRWLGFEVGPARPFGPLGAPFCKVTLRAA